MAKTVLEALARAPHQHPAQQLRNVSEARAMGLFPIHQWGGWGDVEKRVQPVSDAINL